jgi:hypothetical protein
MRACPVATVPGRFCTVVSPLAGVVSLPRILLEEFLAVVSPVVLEAGVLAPSRQQPRSVGSLDLASRWGFCRVVVISCRVVVLALVIVGLYAQPSAVFGLWRFLVAFLPGGR